ncbi:MAG: hypothetical protein KDB61_06560, partial [Planctomycetes bacterium]|nr:hypothetical protein [Planctomycetota bacterium]
SGPDTPAPDADAINQVFYSGQEPGLAQAWISTWRSNEALDPGVLNGTSPFYALRYPAHAPNPEDEWQKRCPNWTREHSEAYDATLTAILATLESTHPEANELRFCIHLAQWANARARERAQNHPAAPEADTQLQTLESELTTLWQTRSRPGGLQDSLRKLRFALHPDGVRP